MIKAHTVLVTQQGLKLVFPDSQTHTRFHYKLQVGPKLHADVRLMQGGISRAGEKLSHHSISR